MTTISSIRFRQTAPTDPSGRRGDGSVILPSGRLISPVGDRLTVPRYPAGRGPVTGRFAPVRDDRQDAARFWSSTR